MCGPGADLLMQVLGDGHEQPGELRAQFFQVWNPANGNLTVFAAVDGVKGPAFEVIGPSSTGKVHVYPGDDVAIGATNDSAVQVSAPYFILRS